MDTCKLIFFNFLFHQRPESIFRRLVGSVTRSMRQRRATDANGLVSNEISNSSLVHGNEERSFLGQRYGQ